ncbi:DNA mismatch repair protein MutS [Humitalea rosea]|uniref:DNA mismatch repair protein MutS n=2 Tax=Humitalea rosea TaxID=990373 RepID=A0A2W7KDH1_9PROT|nr:DNA mismatch repair protein MutS [Humitalea rosea]
MAQWFAAKAAHPDALLFFRMGDFYEMFFEDAHAVAEALDLAVAHRGEHGGKPIPMAGVPHHAAEAYLARLIRRGFRVAICDQMESLEESKKRRAPTIRREVVRLITPGTVTEEALLDGGRPAWLMAVVADGEGFGAAWLDVSTGAFCTEAVGADGLGALLARIDPAEVLAGPGVVLAREDARPAIPPSAPAAHLARLLGVATLDGFGSFSEGEIAAAAMAADYAAASQGGRMPRLLPPDPQGGQEVLAMDAATRKSLEITHSERGTPRDCLLAAVDRTLTAAGARELAGRLASPLTSLAAIEARHDAVAWLLAAPPARRLLREALKGAPDMARAIGRIALDRFSPRDLAAIRDGIGRAGQAEAALSQRPGIGGGLDPEGAAPLPALLAAARGRLGAAPDLGLDAALAATLPPRLDDPGSIAPGYDGELDALRRLRDDARGAIAAMQMDLAQAWGIASLKIRHHQQFGYLAEAPAAVAETLLRAPPKTAEGYAPIHRQTMASAVRFTCTALAALDRRLSEAGAEAARREALVLRALRERVLAAAEPIWALAAALAALDVEAAAAEMAAARGWCRPVMTGRTDFCVLGGRHPVVEAALARAKGPAFVPNDCDLSPGRRLCLLTGPNMAGKSTYLRQNALIVVLAQAGMFVPATEARLGIVDRLFSRVGAADDLAGGRSTFMVEMTETAAILHQAGPRSFVVLDEVGRGTATWDGLAIAWAVLEALHDRIRARAIFATHFHELTALAGRLPELAPAAMQVREHRGQVVFQHSVAPGAAERSWGLHVARLAGVPRATLARAESVLKALEQRARGLTPLAEELPLFAPPPPTASPDPLLAALDALDPDTLAPREALEAIYTLKALRPTPVP